jgi:hypothetical protein
MIFNKFKILEQKSEEQALVYLYTTLIDLTTQQSESFLDSIDNDLLTSDSIVHILNALSPKKNEIKNWDKFVKIAEGKLIELVGLKESKDLMGVIL